MKQYLNLFIDNDYPNFVDKCMYLDINNVI